MRGALRRTGLLVEEARRYGRFVVSYWDDNPFCIPESSSSHAYFADPRVRATLAGILEESVEVVSPTKALAESLARKTGRPVPILGVPSFSPVDPLPDRCRRQGCSHRVCRLTDHLATLQELIIPALEMLDRRGMAFRFEEVGPVAGGARLAPGAGAAYPVLFGLRGLDLVSERRAVAHGPAPLPDPRNARLASTTTSSRDEFRRIALHLLQRDRPTPEWCGTWRTASSAENMPRPGGCYPVCRAGLIPCGGNWRGTPGMEVRQRNAPDAVRRSRCARSSSRFGSPRARALGLQGAMATLGIRRLALWVRLAMDAGPGKAAQRVRQPLRRCKSALHSFLVENPHG